MELGAQIVKFCQFFTEFPVHDPRLQGAQAHPHGHGGAQSLDKGAQRRLLRQIPPPGGDLDTGDDDLAEAPAAKGLRLGHGLLRRHGTHRAPGKGDDAVGAEIAAPVLHLEHGPGAALQAAGGQVLKVPAGHGVVQPLAPLSCAQGVEQKLQKRLPSAAAGQNVRPQRTGRRGIHLAVAAADADHRIGIPPPAAADDGAVLPVSLAGDGTGIDDVAVAGLVKGPDFHAHLLQNLLHCLGFILIDLASQGIKGNLHVITTKKNEMRKNEIRCFFYCVKCGFVI